MAVAYATFSLDGQRIRGRTDLVLGVRKLVGPGCPQVPLSVAPIREARTAVS
jgi:hypothetical protein